MSELMHRTSQAKSHSTDGADADAEASKLAVYIGDSPSDFAPLLRAELGIVVGQNKLLRQVAKAHGVKLLPLTAGQSCFSPHYLSDVVTVLYSNVINVITG